MLAVSAPLHALKEERHFALLDGVVFSNRRPARQSFSRSGTRSDLMRLFGHNRDHGYYFELSRKGERDLKSTIEEFDRNGDNMCPKRENAVPTAIGCRHAS